MQGRLSRTKLAGQFVLRSGRPSEDLGMSSMSIPNQSNVCGPESPRQTPASRYELDVLYRNARNEGKKKREDRFETRTTETDDVAGGWSGGSLRWIFGARAYISTRISISDTGLLFRVFDAMTTTACESFENQQNRPISSLFLRCIDMRFCGNREMWV